MQDFGEWSPWSTEQKKTFRYRKCWDHTSIQYNPLPEGYGKISIFIHNTIKMQQKIYTISDERK